MTNFMAQLSGVEQDELYRSGTRISYRSGAVMMAEGQRGNYVLLIDFGDVKIVKSDVGGKERLLNICGRGELLGEIACVEEDGRRSASVIARSPVVTAIKITKSAFFHFLHTHPHLWPGVLRRVVVLLREAESQSAERSIRVLRAVATLADRYSDGSRGAVIPYTQQEIAAYAQSSRVTVQRVWLKLKKRNLVHSEYRKVVVPCVRCLRAVADAAVSTQIYGDGIICCRGIGVCPQG
ncbi:Crp/Fnr family transcriptional regulator [Saccharothrix sp. HUAS TT1]|uniref:Crp/Fnr family transcriptional regulator n=1 Tax=unclassified Saccharothrix TaxID=2593673 RepID=UPI00345BAFED